MNKLSDTPSGTVIAVVDPKDADASIGSQPLPGTQKALKEFVSRRHPHYVRLETHWDFLESTYEGGREWFKKNIFRYIKEGDTEFGERIERCYRFNHTREVVDLVNKYLFKQQVARKDDAPEYLKSFWEKATKDGESIDELVRQISKKTSIHGRVAIVVDSNAVEGEVLSVAEARRSDKRLYAYIVGPKQILDYSFGESGELNWILLSEYGRDDEDPFTSSGEEIMRWRLWDKNSWWLFEEVVISKRKREIRMVDSGDHNLGIVPVVLADNINSEDRYHCAALIDDIAYLDRAVANYLSNLDAIIQDQTFSQLAMPAQNVMPGEDDYTKMLEMGTKRVFLYDGEGGAQPFYLSPDPKQAALIIDAIAKIINEIYHTVGLAGERTKQDNSVGIDNSSGVAKAYDFERVNALLAAKADALELTENKIAKVVAAWNDAAEDDDFVHYADDFDTRGLYDEFDISAKLSLVQAPPEVRREQMKMLVKKLFPQASKAMLAKVEGELKEWPVDPVELAQNSLKAAALDNKSSQGAVSSKPVEPGSSN